MAVITTCVIVRYGVYYSLCPSLPTPCLPLLALLLSLLQTEYCRTG